MKPFVYLSRQVSTILALIAAHHCSTLSAASLLVNGGFEDGLNGWTITEPPSPPVDYPPASQVFRMSASANSQGGETYAVLSGGRGSSITLSQTFTMFAGQTLIGYADVFAWNEDESGPVPFYISASVTISGGGGSAPVWSDRISVNPGNSVPLQWNQWSFGPVSAGEYTLYLNATNIAGGIGFYGANAAFKEIHVVPDAGGTLSLLVFSMGLMSAIQRRNRRIRTSWPRIAASFLRNIAFALVRTFVVTISCLLGTSISSGNVINGGFESGLSSWTVDLYPTGDSRSGGYASTQSDFLGYYTPTEGQLFAQIESTFGGSIILSQTLFMRAGEILSGYAAAFAPGSAVSYPLSMSAKVIVQWDFQQEIPWTAFVIGKEMSPVPYFTTWTQWSFVAPETSNYTLQLQGASGFGGGFAFFDAVGVPETGSTLSLLFVGLGAIVIVRKAQSKRAGMIRSDR